MATTEAYQPLSRNETYRMKIVLQIVFGSLVCNWCPSAAQAAISGPFTTTTPIAYTLTDWNNILSFPKFNSDLGTLTEVDMYLAGALSTTLTIKNWSPTGSKGRADMELEMSVQDTDGNLTDLQLDLLTPEYSYTLTAGQSETSGLLTTSGTFTQSYTAPAVLALFSGPGNLDLSAFTITYTNIMNSGGNTAASQVTQAELTGSVTYHYDPASDISRFAVPEPCSFIVWAGLGVIGLLGHAWRRTGLSARTHAALGQNIRAGQNAKQFSNFATPPTLPATPNFAAPCLGPFRNLKCTILTIAGPRNPKI